LRLAAVRAGHGAGGGHEETLTPKRVVAMATEVRKGERTEE
jgi:hypothetical protein